MKFALASLLFSLSIMVWAQTPASTPVPAGQTTPLLLADNSTSTMARKPMAKSRTLSRHSTGKKVKSKPKAKGKISANKKKSVSKRKAVARKKPVTKARPKPARTTRLILERERPRQLIRVEPSVRPRPPRPYPPVKPYVPPVPSTVIDARTGRPLTTVPGGTVDPATGAFSVDVGSGYLNPQTGQFNPK